MSSFQTRRDLFDLPEGITYLDGNSLGPLPKSAVERARTTMAEEWGPMLITGLEQGPLDGSACASG
jgi:kynureninase